MTYVVEKFKFILFLNLMYLFALHNPTNILTHMEADDIPEVVQSKAKWKRVGSTIRYTLSLGYF